MGFLLEATVPPRCVEDEEDTCKVIALAGTISALVDEEPPCMMRSPSPRVE